MDRAEKKQSYSEELLLNGSDDELANRFFGDPFDFEALFLAAEDETMGESGAPLVVMLGLAMRNETFQQVARDRVSIDPNLHDLAKLPRGSLGREYFEYVSRHQIDLNFFPKPQGDGLLDWFKGYLRSTHDLMHLVAGYEPHFGEELAFQAFYCSNLRSSFGMLCVAQSLHYIELRHPKLLKLHLDNVVEAYARGALAKPLVWCDWQASWNTPLADIRRNLAVSRRNRPVSTLRK